ncbi:MAG: hypothetical protein DYG98_24975 [Haliscomenobacteraceae bacterium CHB4]|nr:hypothetical protein [Haliscomenobacteraceae bacterium CHB4]
MGIGHWRRKNIDSFPVVKEIQVQIIPYFRSPGITWSTGFIFQFDKFNIGFLLGKDYASGIGDQWIYQDKMWYSFAIGYSFTKPDEK